MVSQIRQSLSGEATLVPEVATDSLLAPEVTILAQGAEVNLGTYRHEGREVDDPADPGALTPVANPGPGCGLLLLVPEVVTVSLLAPEVVTVSLLAPEVAIEAESPSEAAAVGPRDDQAVVGGIGFHDGPLCPVGFDLNLSISSDELFMLPCCLASAVEPLQILRKDFKS